MTYIRLTSLVALLALAACDQNRVTYDGEYFRPKVSKSKEDRRVFSVRVGNAAKTLTGAREAGRHYANSYCLEQFGNSDIIWTNGPDDDDSDLVLSDGNLYLKGMCKGW